MRVATQVLFRPLRDVPSRRRAVHLLIGGGLAFVLALPLVAAVELAPLALLTPAALVAAGFSPALRALERAQANALLGTALAGSTILEGPAERRRRAVDAGLVGWLMLRAVLGAVGTLALLAGAFALTAGVIAPFDSGFFAGESYRSPGGIAAAWLPVAGLAVLLVAVHLADGLGRLEVRAASQLLAATAAEEVALLRARTETLTERERLARELHDSVGHAVTVTLLQARAPSGCSTVTLRRRAARSRRSRRSRTRRWSRSTGCLRFCAAKAAAPTTTSRATSTLLAAGCVPPASRSTSSSATRASSPTFPRRCARAAYRIVQEAVTNALRHAGAAPTRAQVRLDGPDLRVRVTSAAGKESLGAVAIGTGRGLAGVRDRARALGGDATFGPCEDGGWFVEARLPVDPPA